MELDFSLDYNLWDNPVAVVLDGNSVPTALPAQPTDAERAPSNAEYVGTDLTFILPGVLLLADPVPGSIIVWDSVPYTVQTAEYDHIDRNWRCFSLNLRLVYGLSDQITIERAPIALDSLNSPVRNYVPVYSAIPAAVQLDDVEDVSDRGVKGKRSNYTITVDQQLILQADDRIHWGSLYLQYLDYIDSERLDELPKIKARHNP